MGIKLVYYNEDKYGIDNKFIIVCILLILIYVGFMTFFYLKAEEITKDPCSICSKYMGDLVYCTTKTTIPVTKTYYPNGSIILTNPEIIEDYKILPNNFTLK